MLLDVASDHLLIQNQSDIFGKLQSCNSFKLYLQEIYNFVYVLNISSFKIPCYRMFSIRENYPICITYKTIFLLEI
jgi:hypothetical protein